MQFRRKQTSRWPVGVALPVCLIFFLNLAPGWMVLTAIAATGTVLMVLFVRHVRRTSKHYAELIRCVLSMRPEDAASIVTAINALAEHPPNAAWLMSTGEDSGGSSDRVIIPTGLRDHPWSGRKISLSPAVLLTALENDNGATLTSEPCGPGQASVLKGKMYVPAFVPRRSTPSGKPRNVLAVARLLKLSSPLSDIIQRLAPQFPEDFLAGLLMGGFARGVTSVPSAIGGTPDWYQAPLRPACEACGKRMIYAFGLPGSQLTEVSHSQPEAHFYAFLCAAHPEQGRLFSQIT